MTVLSYTNGFLGVPYPQHLSGQSQVQDFNFPGALQPLATGPIVLSPANGFLGVPYPQHLSGQSTVQGFMFPGALQPAAAASLLLLMPQILL
jgi:hypothetical protein